MAKIRWSENQVLSVETREGVFVLGQMIKAPYMLFFDLFRKGNDWTLAELRNPKLLICTAVTRDFYGKSNIRRETFQVDFKGKVPRYWIDLNPKASLVTVWEGTKHERTFVVIGRGGGALIDKDISLDGFHNWPVVMHSIPLTDHKTIDGHELTNIRSFGELNERLYLCYKLGRNVDPLKDLAFERTIPRQYAQYIDSMFS